MFLERTLSFPGPLRLPPACLDSCTSSITLFLFVRSCFSIGSTATDSLSPRPPQRLIVPFTQHPFSSDPTFPLIFSLALSFPIFSCHNGDLGQSDVGIYPPFPLLSFPVRNCTHTLSTPTINLLGLPPLDERRSRVVGSTRHLVNSSSPTSHFPPVIPTSHLQSPLSSPAFTSLRHASFIAHLYSCS